MILCSCTGITDREVRAAVSWMRASDPAAVVTPGKVWRALGRRPDCGGCVSLFVATMREELGSTIPTELRNLRSGRNERKTNEGRPEGHRLSEPRAAL